MWCSVSVCEPVLFDRVCKWYTTKTHVYLSKYCVLHIKSQGLYMHWYDLLDGITKTPIKIVLYRQLSKWIRFVAAVYNAATGARLYSWMGLDRICCLSRDQCPLAPQETLLYHYQRSLWCSYITFVSIFINDNHLLSEIRSFFKMGLDRKS